MIEVLKDKGASNNGSHPKEASDPSHPDVPPINPTEDPGIDTTIDNYHAVISLVEKLHNALDQGNIAITCFLYLKKSI